MEICILLSNNINKDAYINILDIKLDHMCAAVNECNKSQIHSYKHIYTIDIKKVNKQLTHAMHVKDRYENGTFIYKLTKWYL